MRAQQVRYADCRSGQGVSIKLGDKERSEFEDLSAQIHTRLHIWANLGEREVLRSAPDRTTDMAVAIGCVSAHRCSCIQKSRRVLKYTAKTYAYSMLTLIRLGILRTNPSALFWCGHASRCIRNGHADVHS